MNTSRFHILESVQWLESRAFIATDIVTDYEMGNFSISALLVILSKHSGEASNKIILMMQSGIKVVNSKFINVEERLIKGPIFLINYSLLLFSDDNQIESFV